MSATVLYMSMSLDGFIARPRSNAAELSGERGVGALEPALDARRLTSARRAMRSGGVRLRNR